MKGMLKSCTAEQVMAGKSHRAGMEVTVKHLRQADLPPEVLPAQILPPNAPAPAVPSQPLAAPADSAGPSQPLAGAPGSEDPSQPLANAAAADSAGPSQPLGKLESAGSLQSLAKSLKRADSPKHSNGLLNGETESASGMSKRARRTTENSDVSMAQASSAIDESAVDSRAAATPPASAAAESAPAPANEPAGSQSAQAIQRAATPPEAVMTEAADPEPEVWQCSQPVCISRSCL